MRRTTCTAHCAACGRHFSGDGAFDLHRRGDPATGRRCVSAIDEPRLTEATVAGYCAISGAMLDDGSPATLDPVTVWGFAANRTEAKRAAYAALRVSSRVSRGSGVERDRSPSPALRSTEGV